MNARFRSIAGLAAAAAAAIAISAGSASAATTDSLSPASSTPAHSCEVIGSSGVYEAVFCADLVQSGSAYFAQGEAACEKSGVFVACDAVSIAGGEYYIKLPSGATTEQSGYSGSCSGNCVAPRDYFLDGVGESGSGFSFWSIVNAGSSITLPNGARETLSANLGSGHINT